MQSFADVPVTDAGVETESFLLAVEDLIQLFGACELGRSVSVVQCTDLLFCEITDLLGSSAFTVVQNDMRGNVTVSPISPATLEALLGLLASACALEGTVCCQLRWRCSTSSSTIH